MMIGVIANPEDEPVVREFFELFKTPWEWYQRGQRYDVVLCTGEWVEDDTDFAKLVVVYSSEKVGVDDRLSLQTVRLNEQQPYVRYELRRIPLYGSVTAFSGENGFLKSEQSESCLGLSRECGTRTFVRVGYDLFSEVRVLLVEGQPTVNASIPTLDLHIHVLRQMIISSGVPLVEIPPVPEGYSFTVCLTHDVDHPSIRLHKFDHTVAGFAYRALVGSVIGFIKGRTSLKALVENWIACLKLPAVYFGLAKDFWRDFADQYLELEKGLPSTFFVIPFKERAGKTNERSAPKFRAARYGVADIADVVEKLTRTGHEVGLHGIDAWRDVACGQEELQEIERFVGKPTAGVRMHWLFYDHPSPTVLEDAGADYDSTIGYNDTVGYRAGTLQAYKPLSATRLLELPLHAMDTALFYPSYLGLSEAAASDRLRTFVADAVQFGGCITINWHDRSLAPERTWQIPYATLLKELCEKNVWFATTGQTAAWFRKRRAVTFEPGAREAALVKIKLNQDKWPSGPGIRLRAYGGNFDPENNRCGLKEIALDSDCELDLMDPTLFQGGREFEFGL
jgi:hypothetical protein